MADYVRVPQADWQDICDATREKSGCTEKLLSGAIAPTVRGIETGGGGGGNSLDYTCSISRFFYALTLPDPVDVEVSFGSKLTHALYSDAFSYVVYRSPSVKTLKINCEAPISPVSLNCFAEHNKAESALMRVDLSGAVGSIRPTNMSKAFYFRIGLREILGELDVSQCTNFTSAFARCDSLEVVQFKAETITKDISFINSPNLTDATTQNIIDGLADLTGGTAQTLTLHATVGAKLTDAQKASASAKNWTISY